MKSDGDDDTSGDDGDASKSNGDDKRKDLFVIEDARQLAADLVAVLVACEILGLADALGREGLAGFLNPVTADDFDNLPLLVSRFSLLSICWISASLRRGGYKYMDDDDASASFSLGSLVEFSVLLCVGSALAYGAGIVLVTTGVGADTSPWTAEAAFSSALTVALEVFREAVISFTIIMGFRQLYFRWRGGFW